MKVGIIGGGQLGMMLAQAGIKLGHEFIFVDPNPKCPAHELGEVLEFEFNDNAFVKTLCDRADIVTYEFENVDSQILHEVAKRRPLYPSIYLLKLTSDRLTEKEMFASLGIATAPYLKIEKQEDAFLAVEQLGLPFILKTRRFGYDGKGQYLINQKVDIDQIDCSEWQKQFIAEGVVKFQREISLIACRSLNGKFRAYPITENYHKSGILRTSRVLFGEEKLQREAETVAKKIADKFDYVGSFAVEFFCVNGKLVVNEMAPRVHNSGHWTQVGDLTSQFENHIRAIMGEELGNTITERHCGMINVIGKKASCPESRPGLSFELVDYNKDERAGRKLAHINVIADSKEVLSSVLERYENFIS